MRTLVPLATAAMLAVGLTATPASASPCDYDDYYAPDISSVSATPSPLGVGSTAQQKLTVTVVADDDCVVDGVDVELRGADGSWEDTLFLSRDPDRYDLWRGVTYVDPWTMFNGEAGRWTAYVEAYDELYNTANAEHTFSVKRTTSLTANASPEPAPTGSTLTVTGRLTRASWTDNTSYGYGSQYVRLQRRSLTGTYATVKTVKTDAAGYLRTTVTISADGCYRWQFPGNSVSMARSASGDCVDAR